VQVTMVLPVPVVSKRLVPGFVHSDHDTTTQFGHVHGRVGRTYFDSSDFDDTCIAF
jgi:hypothetical protein